MGVCISNANPLRMNIVNIRYAIYIYLYARYVKLQLHSLELGMYLLPRFHFNIFYNQRLLHHTVFKYGLYKNGSYGFLG